MIRLGLWALAAAALSGCSLFQGAMDTAAGYAQSKGYVSSAGAERMKRVGKAGGSVRKDFTPEEERYIGRSVSAQILGKYKAASNERLDSYIRRVGQTVALASDRPDVAYRFLLLESDEPNAFATPGGFIFVTRGLVKLTRSEDELAGVLAHEIEHVGLKHGLKTIQSSQLTGAFTALAAGEAKQYGGDSLGPLADALGNLTDSIVKSLVVNGYSRDKEYEADGHACEVAARAGYDPKGLERVIARLDGASGGLLKTHPAPKDRIAKLSGVSTPASYRKSKVRDERFAAATGR